MFIWLVVSNIFHFHPYLGKGSNLTNIFQRGWNHHQVILFIYLFGQKDVFFSLFGGFFASLLENLSSKKSHGSLYVTATPWTLPGREDPRAHCGTPADSPGWKGGEDPRCGSFFHASEKSGETHRLRLVVLSMFIPWFTGFYTPSQVVIAGFLP